MKFWAIIAIGLGGYICLVNWISLYQSWRTKKHISSVPLVGAVLLGLGLAYFEKTRYFAFLSIVADWGTILLIICIPSLVKQFWEVSGFNLIQTFVGNSKGVKYQLKLYKKGIFVIHADIEPPQIANKYGAKISHYGLQGRWSKSEGIIQLTEYDKDRVATLRKTDDKYLVSEINYPIDRTDKYDLLDGVEFILSNAR